MTSQVVEVLEEIPDPLFLYTFPKFNSEFTPENRPGPKRKLCRLPTIIFQGRAVRLRVCVCFYIFPGFLVTFCPDIHQPI